MSGNIAIAGETELYCPSCETSFAEGRVCPVDETRLVKLITPADPHLGRDIDGRFTILEKLGHGGMGAVYRALQHSVDREVAIKVIHPNLLSDAAVIKRFLREARLASRLSHPNAVGVLDFGQTDDGMFYLVMELLAGRTLGDVFDADGAFEPRRLIRIGIQICDALEAANALSIIHRDLKPDNVVVLDTARDFVKVLDFGLATSLDQDQLLSAVSVSGIIQGSPSYIAPERVCGQPGDARSDLYSLGCMLFLLGSGTLPFAAPAMEDTLRQHVAAPIPSMTGVPAELAHVVERLLAKKPADRYQSAAETRVALEAVLELLRPASSPPVAAFDPSRPLPVVTAPVTPPSQPMPVVSPAERQRIGHSDTMLVASGARSAVAVPRRQRHRSTIAIGLAVAIAAVGLLITEPGTRVVAASAAQAKPVEAAPVRSAPGEVAPPVELDLWNTFVTALATPAMTKPATSPGRVAARSGRMVQLPF